MSRKLVFCLILIALTGVSCQGGNLEQPTTENSVPESSDKKWSADRSLTYTSDELRLSFEHPPKTIVTEQRANEIVISSSPRHPDENPSYALMGTIRQQPDMTLTEFIGNEAAEDAEITEMTVDGHAARKIERTTLLEGRVEGTCTTYAVESQQGVLEIYGHECQDIQFVADSLAFQENN